MPSNADASRRIAAHFKGTTCSEEWLDQSRLETVVQPYPRVGLWNVWPHLKPREMSPTMTQWPHQLFIAPPHWGRKNPFWASCPKTPQTIVSQQLLGNQNNPVNKLPGNFVIRKVWVTCIFPNTEKILQWSEWHNPCCITILSILYSLEV